MNVRNIFVGSGGIRAGWSLVIFVAILAALGALGGLIAKTQHYKPQMSGEIPAPELLIREAVALVMVGIATFIMSRIERRPFLTYGFLGSHRLLRFVYGIVTGFLAISALVALLWMTHLLVFDGIALSGSAILVNALIWGAVFVIVGFVEEMTLRGYPLWTLDRGINFIWASIIVSIVFAGLHGVNPGESPFGLIDVVLISLVFCFTIWVTGSLWFVIGLHAGWDWAQSYFYGVADSGLRMQGHLFTTHPAGNIIWSGGATGPEGSLLAIPILLVIIALVYRAWGKKPGFTTLERRTPEYATRLSS
jgi:uncharacterized protein